MRRYHFAFALLASSSMVLSPVYSALPIDQPALGLQCGQDSRLFSMDSLGNIATIVKPQWCGWTFAVTMDGTPLMTTERGPSYHQRPTLWKINPSTGSLTRIVSVPRNTQCIAVNPIPVPAPNGGTFQADSIFMVAQPAFNPHLLVVQPGANIYADVGPLGNGYNWWHDAECAFNSEGQLFMVTQTASNYRIQEVNTATGELLRTQTLDLDIRFLESITFTDNGDLVATGVCDKLRIWAFIIDPVAGRMHQKRLLRNTEDGQAIGRASIAIQPTAPTPDQP